MQARAAFQIGGARGDGIRLVRRADTIPAARTPSNVCARCTQARCAVRAAVPIPGRSVCTPDRRWQFLFNTVQRLSAELASRFSVLMRKEAGDGEAQRASQSPSDPASPASPATAARGTLPHCPDSWWQACEIPSASCTCLCRRDVAPSVPRWASTFTEKRPYRSHRRRATTHRPRHHAVATSSICAVLLKTHGRGTLADRKFPSGDDEWHNHRRPYRGRSKLSRSAGCGLRMKLPAARRSTSAVSRHYGKSTLEYVP